MMTAKLLEPAGAPDHESASVEATPSQVYSAGRTPPSRTVGLVRLKPLDEVEEAVRTEVWLPVGATETAVGATAGLRQAASRITGRANAKALKRSLDVMESPFLR